MAYDHPHKSVIQILHPLAGGDLLPDYLFVGVAQLPGHVFGHVHVEARILASLLQAEVGQVRGDADRDGRAGRLGRVLKAVPAGRQKAHGAHQGYCDCKLCHSSDSHLSSASARFLQLDSTFWSFGGRQGIKKVELAGFEPATLSMPWRCATSCAIAPTEKPKTSKHKYTAKLQKFNSWIRKFPHPERTSG